MILKKKVAKAKKGIPKKLDLKKSEINSINSRVTPTIKPKIKHNDKKHYLLKNIFPDDTKEDILASGDNDKQIELFKVDIEAFCEHVLGMEKKDKQQLEFMWTVCKLVNAKIKINKEKIYLKRVEFYDKLMQDKQRQIAIREERNVKRLKWQKFLTDIRHKITEEDRDLAMKTGIAVKAGRGTGKTYALAAIALWFMLNFPSKMIATAPKQDLLRDNLWGYFHNIKARSIAVNGEGSLIDAGIEIFADRLELKNFKDNVCVARTSSRNASDADQIGTLSGYHADFFCALADESYSIPNKVFEPLDATLSGPINFIILAGNPTKNHGFAADAWKENKKKYWITLRMNAEESSFVTREHIERLRDKYADDPNGYRVNVLGLEPIDDTDALIPYSAITKCCDLVLPKEIYQNEPCVFGCDIGGGSDLTVVTMLKGMKVSIIGTYNSRDTYEIAEYIASLIEVYRPIKIGIDGIGIGSGVYNDLRHMGYRKETSFIDSRAKSIDQEKFLNKRAELFWKLREKIIRTELELPEQDNLKSELSILKLVNEEFNKKIQIISKSALKKEGQKSPNYADSLMICMAFNMNRLKIDQNPKMAMRKRQEEAEMDWMCG